MTTLTDRYPINTAEITPTPGWTPTSPLLTAVAAARYLRLAEGKDDEAAVKAINRLVDRRKLRPALLGNRRFYSKKECDRCIDDLTASWTGEV